MQLKPRRYIFHNRVHRTQLATWSPSKLLLKYYDRCKVHQRLNLAHSCRNIMSEACSPVRRLVVDVGDIIPGCGNQVPWRCRRGLGRSEMQSILAAVAEAVAGIGNRASAADPSTLPLIVEVALAQPKRLVVNWVVMLNMYSSSGSYLGAGAVLSVATSWNSTTLYFT